MAMHKTCDGVKRRDFLRAGAAGFAGLNLADFSALQAQGAVQHESKGKAAIFINLPGGPSHMDTFDLKQMHRVNTVVHLIRSKPMCQA